MSDYFEVNHVSGSDALVQGQITLTLLDKLNWSEEAKSELVASSVNILSRSLMECQKTGKTTGLVVGYVQSGKTISFSTVLALAADNNFKLAIVFAGVTNQLLQQTTARLSDELVGDNWWDIHVQDDHKTIVNLDDSDESRLVIIPVLKSAQRISELRLALERSQLLFDRPVLIIDDEADQASFNTLAQKNSREGRNDMSATFSAISGLRDSLKNHVYIQYTATPQAPLLINITELLSPDWHVVLEPGIGYFGGKQLFRENPGRVRLIPSEEAYHSSDNPLSNMPSSLEVALLEFIIASTIHLRIRKNSRVISMMVHPERVKEDHKKFYLWIKAYLKGALHSLEANDGLIESKLESAFDNYIGQIKGFPDLNTVISNSKGVIQRMSILLLNSDRQQQEINWNKHKCTILVGGDLLNRGFTVEGLVITYMPRYSKSKSNADTLQQRARFFGYKTDVEDLIRVHLPVSTFDDFSLYVDDEEVIRDILKKSHSVQELRQTIVQNPVMRPTRANILSRKVIQSELTGAKYFKFHSINDLDYNTRLLHSFIVSNKDHLNLYYDFGTVDRNHLICHMPVDEVIDLMLNLYYSNPKAIGLKTAVIQYLLHWSSQESELQQIDSCAIIFMASGNVRERKVFINDDELSIQQIFSGRSAKGEYPGDMKICDDNCLTIQIHRLKPIGTENDGEFWVPALIFPEDLSINFASTSEG